jgi:hypothetical protein
MGDSHRRPCSLACLMVGTIVRPRYNSDENNVLARCPDCDTVTSFDTRGHGHTTLGTVIINQGQTHEGVSYSRILWQAFRCNVCSRGAIAKILDQGRDATAVLVDFLPGAIEKAALPPAVPDDIVHEFREAELDASHGAYRSGSALLRSVLEKTLKKNGYEEVEFRDASGNIVNDSQGNPRKSNKLIHRVESSRLASHSTHWQSRIHRCRGKRSKARRMTESAMLTCLLAGHVPGHHVSLI